MKGWAVMTAERGTYGQVSVVLGRMDFVLLPFTGVKLFGVGIWDIFVLLKLDRQMGRMDKSLFPTGTYGQVSVALRTYGQFSVAHMRLSRTTTHLRR